ncbi:MAG: GNAT family N-acetyltransferase, partial [Clostridia bacterium]|nr:GNAT family N-acetyltransferase [Clostridia bacterium]
MLHLSRFSLTWPADWVQFCSLMEAYLTEVCSPEDARREIAELHDETLSAQLIQQSYRKTDPYFIMRIIQDSACIGLISYSYQESRRRAFINNFYVLPDHRGQGLGSEAYALAEDHLRRLGARTLALEPEEQALPFYLRKGYQPSSSVYLKEIPRYQGGSPMQLLYYTRAPMDEAIYAPKLAHSLHLALIEEGKCTPLLHNSGIVYARAVSDTQGVLHPYSLLNPWITFLKDGTWAVVARRVEADGSPDAASEGHLLHFTTEDLIHYTEQPLMPVTAPLAQAYLAREAAETAHLDLPEGCIPCGILDISEDVAERLRCRFLTPVNIANEVPVQVEAASPDDLRTVKALARYS